MNSDKQQAKKDKEEESLSELTYSKLEVVWNDVKFMKKLLLRFSELESDKVALWCLFAFAAEKGAELGQTKEEFLDSVGQAYDDVTSTEEEEEEDDIEIPDEGSQEEDPLHIRSIINDENLQTEE